MNRIFEQGATLLLSACCAVLLGSCGSGAVSAPDPAAGTALAVSPAIADVFPDIPTTFSIKGGTPAYSVFSSNNVALPLNAAVIGSTFTAVPNGVAADTSINITVRDAANTSITATANIHPSTLINQITFTPFAPTGTGCGTGLCSGGDAQIVVQAVLNGVVLRARPIRFDVYQGDFQIVPPGSGVLVNTLVVNTDQQGAAVVRITTATGVPTQTATLQATDTTSGLARRFNFTIVQQTSGVGILSVLPSSPITVKGAKGLAGAAGLCPGGYLVNFYVYGGTPPYSIVSPLPQVAIPLTNTVPASGSAVTVAVNGCGTVSLIVTDSKGLTIESPQIVGQQGDAGDTTSLSVFPSTTAATPLTVGCAQSTSINLVGAGTFTTAIVTAGVDPTKFTITPPAGTIPSIVTFSRSAVTGVVPLVPSSITVNVVAGTSVTPVFINNLCP